jgi:hypothetical protein
MSIESTIILDGHAHLYPAYRLPVALDALFTNLARCAPGADAPIRIGLLADTAACRAYRDRIAQPRPKQADRFILQPTDEPAAMAIREEDRLLGYLIAGRQIVTAERLEVLALTVDLDLPDGRPLGEVLAAIREAGGVATLPWSPGKWSGARGRLVRQQVETECPSAFLLGDTSLRPNGWPTPLLFKDGLARGFHVLRGTDPLPFPGEESRLGTCATLLRGPWDPARPATSVRRLLADPACPFKPAGRRLSPAGFVTRWGRMMTKKYLRL